MKSLVLMENGLIKIDNMFKDDNTTESVLNAIRKIVPDVVFSILQPMYHRLLSVFGAIIYRFPARGMTIIGVTGTKGKSTVTYMIARALEDQGVAVAAIGSLGYKIRDKEWPNNLHMTMPGRMKLQKFLREARNAGVTHVVLEVTSQGMVQGRLFGIPVDGAILINIHPEHVESHGGFDNYVKAKQILFHKAKHVHVLNAEDIHKNKFRDIPAQETVFFGMKNGGTTQKDRNIKLKLKGDFNIYNALAALATIKAYGFDIDKAQRTIESIDRVAGRMEYVKVSLEERNLHGERSRTVDQSYDKTQSLRQDFDFVVDYAHTPESLEAVYKTLKKELKEKEKNLKLKAYSLKLIAIFGSDGGGRDTWKRPVFGRIASQYCDEIILTSENPYDTDPDEIADEIQSGLIRGSTSDETTSNEISSSGMGGGGERARPVIKRIIDRRQAMEQAVIDARKGDIIVITGKGTEDSIVMAEGKKIPWLDSDEARKAIIKILNEK